VDPILTGLLCSRIAGGSVFQSRTSRSWGTNLLFKTFDKSWTGEQSVTKIYSETGWLDLAEYTIIAAREIKDPSAKTQLLLIAKAYLTLARFAREQADLRKKSRIFD
jgi:hypothetical protein